MRNDFPQITIEKGCEFRIPDSRSYAFHKPTKTWPTVNKTRGGGTPIHYLYGYVPPNNNYEK